MWHADAGSLPLRGRWAHFESAVGSIQLIRAALPHLRAQGGGRVIQISSHDGQVAFAGNSLYHATK